MFFQKGYLIVLYNNPISKKYRSSASLKDKLAKRKNVNLYLGRGNVLHKESISIIWLPNDLDNLNHIVSSWLSLLYQEQIVKEKIYLKNVALSLSKQDVYLTFDKSFITSSSSIKAKWLVIESILKTIRESLPSFSKVFFMVDSLPIEDEHLDFSQGWSIDGFLNE